MFSVKGRFLFIVLMFLTVAYGCVRGPRLAALEAITGAPDVIPAEAITGWFCPMHPDVTSSEAGNCKKCGMALKAGDPFDTRDYELDFWTEPQAVKAAIPFKMFFKIRHPGSGKDIKLFEIVHDKRYHLFVISQDMNFFEHIHPEVQADGTWAIDVKLPKPGYYRVLSDFLPTGGSPQFLGRSLVTADFDGDLLSQVAQLKPDTVLKKTVNTITAEVRLDPPRLMAGSWGHLAFKLTDAENGEPITDLQPYLGAYGHTLVLSEDLLDYVHSHPAEGPESDLSKGFGGPNMTFEGYMPRAGRYRAWTQFLRKGELTTVSFTFNVLTLEEAVGLP